MSKIRKNKGDKEHIWDKCHVDTPEPKTPKPKPEPKNRKETQHEKDPSETSLYRIEGSVLGGVFKYEAKKVKT